MLTAIKKRTKQVLYRLLFVDIKQKQRYLIVDFYSLRYPTWTF